MWKTFRILWDKIHVILFYDKRVTTLVPDQICGITLLLCFSWRKINYSSLWKQVVLYVARSFQMCLNMLYKIKLYKIKLFSWVVQRECITLLLLLAVCMTGSPRIATFCLEWNNRFYKKLPCCLQFYLFKMKLRFSFGIEFRKDYVSLSLLKLLCRYRIVF